MYLQGDKLIIIKLAYSKQHQKLINDYDRIEQVYKVLERIRLEYCNIQVRQ